MLQTSIDEITKSLKYAPLPLTQTDGELRTGCELDLALAYKKEYYVDNHAVDSQHLNEAYQRFEQTTLTLQRIRSIESRVY